MGSYCQERQGWVSFSNVRPDGYLRVSKTNRRILNKLIVLPLPDQVLDVQLNKAANLGWDLYHMDLKTAFLAHDETRDIICEIPKECGIPSTHRR